MSQFVSKVKKTIIDYSMIEENANVLLCVSGGMDSMAMLDLFSSLRAELKIKLAVCHLNHNLRADESERDQSFVEKAAAQLGFEFYTGTLKEGELKDVGGSLQESAREARYAFFDEAAGSFNADRVALAHNLDDQAETVLMRILKGSGLKGLRAMPAVRAPYIRPFIEVTRAEIEAYVKKRGVEFVEDSSNESIKYLRNKLRLKLIPELEREYNPAIKEALISLSASARRDYSFIEKEAAKLFTSAKEEGSEGRVVLSRERLAGAHPALSARAFLIAVESLKGDVREFYSVHIESFLTLVNSIEPGASVDLPGGMKVRREYDRVIIESALASAVESKVDNGYEVELNMAGVTFLGDTDSTFVAEIVDGRADPKGSSKDFAFFDLDVLESIGSPLIVRTFRPGDRMTPLGMRGVKKVQDIFVDDKVAKLKRAGVPLLLCVGEVLWIAGLRQSECAKLTPKTLRTLRLKWHKGSVK